MEKFIKLFKSGTGQNKGDILIPVAGIVEIKQVMVQLQLQHKLMLYKRTKLLTMLL